MWRSEISWIVLQESELLSVCTGISETWKARNRRPPTGSTTFRGVFDEYGVPPTSHEIRLAQTYNLYARIDRLGRQLRNFRIDLHEPDTWHDDHVTGLIPVLNSTSVDPPHDRDQDHPLDMSDEEAARAESLLARHLRSRAKALEYLRAHPPKPMGWAPRSTDAWRKPRKVDIDAGNLHGRAEWKPIYRAWASEPEWRFWTDPHQTERDAAVELEGLKDSNAEHATWKRRKEEYLGTLRER